MGIGDRDHQADGAAADAGAESAARCPHCQGEGIVRWTQPCPDGNGGTILRDMAMPCPHGCGPTWKHPAAEADRVITTSDDPSANDRPDRVPGQVDAMEATGRVNGYGAFLQRALAQAGYTFDEHGRRQSLSLD